MRSSEGFNPRVEDIPDVNDIANTKEIEFVDIDKAKRKVNKRYKDIREVSRNAGKRKR